MDPANTHPPILARQDGDERPSVVSHADNFGLSADDFVERIRANLAKDLYLPARDLAALAIRHFPEHPEIQRLWRVFDNRGKSWVVKGETEPDTDEEFEWLRQPPEWAKGKWVALIGSKAVAVADTLREVVESIHGQKLSKRPLVHRVDFAVHPGRNRFYFGPLG